MSYRQKRNIKTNTHVYINYIKYTSPVYHLRPLSQVVTKSKHTAEREA